MRIATHIHTHTYSHKHTQCARAHTHTHTHTFTRIYAHVHTHAHKHTQPYTHTHTHINSISFVITLILLFFYCAIYLVIVLVTLRLIYSQYIDQASYQPYACTQFYAATTALTHGNMIRKQYFAIPHRRCSNDLLIKYAVESNVQISGTQHTPKCMCVHTIHTHHRCTYLQTKRDHRSDCDLTCDQQQ